jgi:hypothetical protein
MSKKLNPPSAGASRVRGFTIIEVCLIVAIIGMMMMIIVGYFLAGRQSVTSPAYAPSPATPAPAPAATPQLR